ncbi:MAG TPA: MarR family winged helix-turn-helix transcriptional regulator [Ignavibacteria bacterium]|nr:MarR family winged helix-turn-helix transcriptional regulator [Ignavibacteria bacterium]
MKNSVINLIFGLKFSCMAKEEKIIKELGLSPAEYRGILSIVPGSEIPCNILSRKMGLSVSRGSRVIDKLINNGYLKEFRSKSDQRVTNLELTLKGIKTQRKIHNLLEDCEQTILKNMTEHELEAFTASLTKISDILISR